MGLFFYSHYDKVSRNTTRFLYHRSAYPFMPLLNLLVKIEQKYQCR